MFHYHLILLPIIFILLSSTVFWVWAFIDCILNEPDSSIDGSNSKILWVIIIALTHSIGALIYVILRRPQRIKERGR